MTMVNGFERDPSTGALLVSGAGSGSAKGIYIPDGWGEFWLPRLAASGDRLARIGVVGDSLVAGYGTSSLDTGSWPALLREALQADFGDGGSGWKGTADTPTGMTALGVDSDWRSRYAADQISESGNWYPATAAPNGPGSVSVGEETPGATLTARARGSTIRIFTMRASGFAGFEYQVDGGAWVPVATGTSGPDVQVTEISTTPGEHTIVVRYPDGRTGDLYVSGFDARHESGVVVDKFGRYGVGSGPFNNADATRIGEWTAGRRNPVDLVIYSLAVNDQNIPLSGDEWASNARRYLQGVRDGEGTLGDCDIMLVLPHIGDLDHSNWVYQDYAARARGLAEAFGAVLVDFWAIGRNSYAYWADLGYWAEDEDPIHLSDAGAQHVADTLLPIITGQ